jgi:hypothetical protein
MTRAQLFREYARVIEMCEGTSVNPNECVKVRGQVWSNVALYFKGVPRDFLTFTDTPTDYTFALCIVEDKPVFAGDKMYRLVKIQIGDVIYNHGEIEVGTTLVSNTALKGVEYIVRLKDD